MLLTSPKVPTKPRRQRKSSKSSLAAPPKRSSLKALEGNTCKNLEKSYPPPEKVPVVAPPRPVKICNPKQAKKLTPLPSFWGRPPAPKDPFHRKKTRPVVFDPPPKKVASTVATSPRATPSISVDSTKLIPNNCFLSFGCDYRKQQSDFCKVKASCPSSLTTLSDIPIASIPLPGEEPSCDRVSDQLLICSLQKETARLEKEQLDQSENKISTTRFGT